MLRAEGRGSGLAGSGVEHSVERRGVEGRVSRVTRATLGHLGQLGVNRPTAMPIHNKSLKDYVFFDANMDEVEDRMMTSHPSLT